MINRKLISTLLVITALTGGFIACQSIRQMRNFAQCSFRLQGLSKFTAAGIDFSEKRSLTDFNFTDAAKITSALAGSNPFVFSFLANVEVKNPNAEPAAVTQLDWILAIDGKDVINGAVNTPVRVAPNGGLATMPVAVSLDLKKIFAEQGRDAMLNFAFDAAAKGGNSARIGLKVKPYINIAGFAVPYPGYIAIKQEF